MDVVVVNLGRKFELGILALEEWRIGIFSCYVVAAPVVVWFDIVHGYFTPA
jgi:hypothetical protein